MGIDTFGNSLSGDLIYLAKNVCRPAAQNVAGHKEIGIARTGHPRKYVCQKIILARGSVFDFLFKVLRFRFAGSVVLLFGPVLVEEGEAGRPVNMDSSLWRTSPPHIGIDIRFAC